MSPARLDGKVAVITGAAGGIGAATARLFANAGAHLILTDADAEGAARLADELGAPVQARRHDVTQEADWSEVVQSAVQLHGRLDVLVNNAGVFLAASLADTSPEDFRRVIDVNTFGVFLGMRAAAPAMHAAGGGAIINISSIAGLTGGPYLTAYAASKWAVRGMTRVAARELARSGVRVVSVHPGQIETQMHAAQHAATPQLVDKLVRGIPMRRIGRPEEIARAVAFLASDDSSYVTGTELVLDGGATA